MSEVVTALAGLGALALLRRSAVVKARRADAERRRLARRAALGDLVLAEPSAHFLLERDGSLTQIVEDRRVRVGNREVWI